MVSWCDMGDFGSVIPSGLHDNKLFGIVVWKMVNIQAQVLFQTESENFIPFEMTRFSKQFVPDLASCSLSETERNPSKVTARQDWQVNFSNANVRKKPKETKMIL